MPGMRSVPVPPWTWWLMGTLSTPLTVPISWAKSARGPPSWPLKTLTSASRCCALVCSSTSRTSSQFPARMLPGMCATATRLRPDTSMPVTCPLSMCQATTAKHSPPSGSSPIQHGQSTLQEHASISVPCSEYTAPACGAACWVWAIKPSFRSGRRAAAPLPLPEGVTCGGTVVTGSVHAGCRASEGPGGRGLPGRGVGAVPAGSNRGGQVVAEGRALPGDRPDRLLDGLGDADPRPLRRRGQRPVATAEAHASQQPLGEGVHLLLGAGGPFRVAPGPGLLQVLLQLAQPAPVRRLGLRIEQAVGLIQPRPPEPGLKDGTGGQPPGGFGGQALGLVHQLQHMNLPARPAQQAGEIAQALHVSETGCLARVGHRPVVTLPPEDSTRH